MTSQWEELFALQCRGLGVDVVREFKFHPSRKWRADFALPQKKILIEIEGGVWIKGRHQTGSGFTADCEKYNAAAELCYRVFRFTPDMVQKGTAIAIVSALA